jgi:hypothetical protein
MIPSGYHKFHGDSFFESFLLDLEVVDWPNKVVMHIWSSCDCEFYNVVATTVLEFHFSRIGTGDLVGNGGLPLDGIFTSRNEEFEYWLNRVNSFRASGIDKGSDPICLELHSHLLANRFHNLNMLTRNVGLLIVCRQVEVTRVPNYDGPKPVPHRIPAEDE